MNNSNVTADLKKKTLKAAKKAYITKKILQAGSVVFMGAMLIICTVVFFPKNTPSPDITAETASAEKEVYMDDDVPENEPLTMCTDNTLIIEFASIYNNTTDSRKIETPDSYETMNTEALYSLLLRELAAGEGPDIIYLSSNLTTEQSIQSLADAGYFADIDTLINSHEGFDLNDFNKDVMDALLIDGKRYFLPYQYNVSYFISTEEKFSELSLEIPEIFDIDCFLELSESFYEKTESKASLFTYFPTYSFFFDILKEGEIQRNSQTERYFSAIRKEFQTHMGKDETLTAYSAGINGYLSSNTLFYLPSSCENMKEQYEFLDRLRRAASAGSAAGTAEILLFSDISNTEGTGKGYVLDCFAVNANSQLKNEAFDFVEYILYEQDNMPGGYCTQIPVYKKAFDADKKYILENAEKIGIPESAQQFVTLIESANDFEFRQMNTFVYSNFIYNNDKFQKYLDGEATFEEMADSVNQDIEKWYG